MGIGLTGEHAELAASVRAFATRHIPREVVRAAVAVDPADEPRPSYWPALAGQGLLGPHLPESHGGQGFTLVELAIVVEEMGRAATPGPYIPTVLTSAVIHAAEPESELLPGLADGTDCGTLSLESGLTARRDGDALVVSGVTEPVLGGMLAEVLVLPVEAEAGELWVALHRSELGGVEPLEGLDPVRGVARVTARDVRVPEDRVLTGLTRAEVLAIAAVVFGAEACGVAGWAVDTAAAY